MSERFHVEWLHLDGISEIGSFLNEVWGASYGASTRPDFTPDYLQRLYGALIRNGRRPGRGGATRQVRDLAALTPTKRFPGGRERRAARMFAAAAWSGLPRGFKVKCYCPSAAVDVSASAWASRANPS